MDPNPTLVSDAKKKKDLQRIFIHTVLTLLDLDLSLDGPKDTQNHTKTHC